MATVPTGPLERELRKLYLRWVLGLPAHQDDIEAYIRVFREESLALIKRMGGDIARLGVAASFPAPRELELDLVAGKVYDQMELAAIRASIATGLNSQAAARALLRAGLDKSYRALVRTARTETVRAYWRNQWDEVDSTWDDVVMLWSSEYGPRTCDYCKDRDGLVVEDRSIRDHPNGRCTLAPTLRSNVEYKGTLQADGTITYDPKWSARNRRAAARAEAALGPLATTGAQNGGQGGSET